MSCAGGSTLGASSYEHLRLLFIFLYLASNFGGKPVINALFIVVLDSSEKPDAHWVAYSSNEPGRMEVYVSPFPSMNP